MELTVDFVIEVKSFLDFLNMTHALIDFLLPRYFFFKLSVNSYFLYSKLWDKIEPTKNSKFSHEDIYFFICRDYLQ